ncbi:MAG: ABC transporter permease [Defluviitaleaceae bacterium]|nr:ABC transporter permease [Defluviitaleaceae bacterium]MCL2238548.1 ABC transporter permease [Defluviitaleaceae bacterium]
MWKTVVRRLLIMIPQLVALSVVMFVIAWFMPGDALRGLVGPDSPPGELTRLRQEAGLLDPWYVQYGRWIRDISQGDFGRSLAHNVPVTTVIGERMMNTVRLSIVTTFLLYLFAIPMGIVAGRRNGRLPDKIVLFYTFLALSMPTVVLALLMIFAFAFNAFNIPVDTAWFPLPAMGTIHVDAHFAGGWTAVANRIQHLILPSVTGALLGSVGTIYFLRNEIIDVQTSDFVTTARSKGVPEGKVYTRHILRNAILPVAGGMGASIALVFTGSIFIESVFTYQGMGLLFIQSIQLRDWPVANTLIMFYAIIGVVAGLLADIAIMIVDPRIRIK